MIHIEIENLTCFRGGRLVLKDLSFNLSPGEAVVVKGANGSGKSTLLRTVAGLVDYQRGSVSWKGREAESEDARLAEDDGSLERLVHYVGHLDAVKPALSVGEALSFWGMLYGDPDGVRDALGSFGLAKLYDVPGEFLSAGQRRRLNLARILLGARPLWILDEPTVSLDEAGVGQLREAVAQHLAQDGLLLAATHIDLGWTNTKVLELETVRGEG